MNRDVERALAYHDAVSARAQVPQWRVVLGSVVMAAFMFTSTRSDPSWVTVAVAAVAVAVLCVLIVRHFWGGRVRRAWRQDPAAVAPGDWRLYVAIAGMVWPSAAMLLRWLMDPVPLAVSIVIAIVAGAHWWWIAATGALEYESRVGEHSV